MFTTTHLNVYLSSSCCSKIRCDESCGARHAKAWELCLSLVQLLLFRCTVCQSICAAQKPYCHTSCRLHDGNGSEILLTLLLSARQGEEPARTSSSVPQHSSPDGKREENVGVFRVFLDMSRISYRREGSSLLTVFAIKSPLISSSNPPNNSD